MNKEDIDRLTKENKYHSISNTLLFRIVATLMIMNIAATAFNYVMNGVLDKKYILLLNISISVVISMLIGLLIVKFFMDAVLNPIKKVTVASKLVANGDFEQAIEHKSQDEIGEFIKNFNFMIQELKYAHLERIDFIHELEFLNKIPDKNPHPIFKIDKMGTVSWSNNAGKNLFNSDISGMEIEKVNLSINFDEVERLLKQGGIIKRDTRMMGRPYNFIFDGIPESEVVIAYGYDLTEERKLHQQIKDEQEKSIHSARLASIGELSSSISHEISNPLSIISGFNNRGKKIIQKENIDKEQLEKVFSKIEMASGRIVKIIRSMKTAARDGSEDPFEKTLISDLFEVSIEFSREKLLRDSITLSVNKFDDNLALICSEVQLSQALIILINNSRDAIVKSKNPWINVKVNDLAESNEVEIIFTDSGYGIPIEIQEKIFDSFFTTKQHGRGTGLGLNVLKKIVEQHKGSIIINNSCENTQFIIKIPKNPIKTIIQAAA